MNDPDYGVYSNDGQHHVFKLTIQDTAIILTHVAQFDDRATAINFCDTWRGATAPTE